ncbi:MAG TPA: SDR family oxidoreductase [Candidatus Dormibacteraeota bacterium]|nr:SDR family oxidoreductase [Candidatus Dormibacteraeota bacterium]
MAASTPVPTREPVVTDWGPFSLAGKNALITGAAMGIGFGIAKRFIEAGANVVVADLVDPTSAADKLDAPGRAVGVALDVSDDNSCQLAVDRCVSAFGSIDILVNVAGIYPMSPVLEMTPAFFDKVIAVNLHGLVFMSKAVALAMVKQGKGGKIVNIASIDSLHPSSVGLAAYDASKGGVLMFTKNFALEMAPHGVNVNALAPGGIATEGGSKGMTGMSVEEIAALGAAFIKMIPVGRMGEPDDIAKVTVFLASSAADYMTGELVVVDGGRLLS